MISPSRAVERLGASQRNLAERLPKPKVPKIVSLGRGDPSFETPAYIVEAANRAIRDGYTHYPPPQGDADLREAVAAYQSQITGVDISASEVVITNGGTGAVYSAMTAFLNEGDEVIILDPTYSLYADVARVIGASIVSVPLTAEFRVDVEAVRAAVTPRAKMIVLNYPSNPTGRLLERDELDELAKIAVEHDLVVVSDEVYDQLVFSGTHFSVLGHPMLTDRTVLVNSVSKTYAMTGWRIGWAVAEGSLFKPVAAISRTSIGYPSSIAMRAALEALSNKEEDEKWRAWMLDQYRAQRKAMWEGLKTVPGIQVYDLTAAFYAWVKYNLPLSSVEMMAYLYERGLNVRPGTEFGQAGEGHLRFTFAPAVPVIQEGVAIFKAAVEELRK